MGHRVRLLFLLICLISIGCKKESLLEKRSDGSYLIKPADYNIDSIQARDWKVGKNFKQKVSRGFSVTLNLPKLSEKSLLELHKTRKASAWLIRVKRGGAYGDEVLATLAVPFIHLKKNQVKVGNISRVTFQILYAASSISMRLSNLNCPAFNHRKKIEAMSINHEPSSLKLIVISPIEEYKLNNKVTEFSYGNITFNGGNQLKGKYSFELALYGTGDSQKKSSWLAFEQIVEVVKEQEVDLKGCEGDVVPMYDDKSKKGVEKFKFGR